MVLPPDVDRMTDAELKRWLIKESGYSALAADFVVDVVRGRADAEGLD